MVKVVRTNPVEIKRYRVSRCTKLGDYWKIGLVCCT